MSDQVDESSVVSLSDVVEEEERLEADANAVLGDSNDKECTFSEGYVRRQALYACATCPTTSPAGICLACSFTCHNGHDLYELYTKRNFRCDCGTSKFPDVPCRLTPKNCVNIKNKYNQNFRGLYCTCHRPYPDDEDDVEDEMIQCIICEDWYHGRHLGRKVETDFEEMICQQCVKEHKFLLAYSIGDSETTVIKKEETESLNGSSVDVETEDSTSPSKAAKVEAGEEVKKEPAESVKTEPSESVETQSAESVETQSAESVETQSAESVETQSAESKDSTAEESSAETKSESQPESSASSSQPSESRLLVEDLEQPSTSSSGGSSSCSSSGSEGVDCVYQQLCARTMKEEPVTLFLPSNWRSKLCRCTSCTDIYFTEDVLYLLDEDDTVKAYEKRGEARNPARSDSEVVMEALSSLNHFQKVEVISGYNDLKTSMTEYFRKFAENGKVVREEDIHEFFQNMQNKRQRTQGPTWYCR